MLKLVDTAILLVEKLEEGVAYSEL